MDISYTTSKVYHCQAITQHFNVLCQPDQLVGLHLGSDVQAGDRAAAALCKTKQPCNLS